MKRIVFGLAVCLAAVLLSASAMPGFLAAQDGETPLVLVLKSEGPITPVLIEYLDRGVKMAVDRGAEVIIFELDTP
ncbi:MAG: hypothetical protein AAGU05_10145, partial [Anaerolineaceae bacterium]